MNIFEDIGYLITNYYQFFLYGLLSTIILSVFGTVVGLFLGIFIALGKRLTLKKTDKWYNKIWKGFVLGIANIYSTVIRGTPMMVQAMVFKYGCQALGVNWNTILPGAPVLNGWLVAGLIVITFNTAAYMGEIVKSGINGVDNGQFEGARSLGLTSRQTMSRVVLPQAIRNAIPTIGNEWIVNIKDSSVLNVIGVTELYLQAKEVANKGYRFIAAYIIIAILYLILTLCTTGILKLVEYKLDGKKFKFSLFHYRNKEAK